MSEGDVPNSFTYTVENESNYPPVEPVIGTLTVTPTTLTVTARPQTYTYNGSAQGPEGTYTSGFDTYVTVVGLQGSDQLTSVTLTGQETDAGVYDDEIIPSAAEIGANTDNYVITYVPADLAILNPNTILITSSDHTWTYDGEEHTEPTYTVTYDGVTGTATPNGDGTYSYTLPTGDVVTITPDPDAHVTNVSEGDVPNSFTYTVENPSSYSGVVPDFGTLAVTPAELTVTAQPQTYVYNGSAQGPAGTYTSDFDTYVTVVGLMPGDELTSVTVSGSRTNAGVYPTEILPSDLEIGTATSNYSITYVPASLTITPILTITATSETKPYDGTALVGSYTSDGLLAGDELNVTLNGSQLCVGETANEVVSYSVMRAGVDVTDQYVVATEDGLLTVTPVTTGFACPAAVTLTLNDCDDNMVVTESQLGTPTHALISAGVATALNNLALVNPMAEGTHAVKWYFLDGCGNKMDSCTQLVTIQRPECVGVTYHGHPYPAVQIGSQCWLAENLRNEEDADGNPIVNFHPLNDDPANVDTYGYLYSWYSAVGVEEGNDAVMPTTYLDDCGDSYVRGICPAGWAVPSQEDVNKLRAAIEDNVSVLKGMDPQYWLPGAAGTTPNTGFNALAGGFYNSATGRYERINLAAYFWESNSTLNVSDVITVVISYYCDYTIEEISPKSDLRPVRCVRKIAH